MRAGISYPFLVPTLETSRLIIWNTQRAVARTQRSHQLHHFHYFGMFCLWKAVSLQLLFDLLKLWQVMLKQPKRRPRNRATAQWTETSLPASAVATCEVQDRREKNTSLARHVHTDIPPGQAGIAQLSSKKSGKNWWQQIVYCDVDGWSSWDFGWKHGESNIQWSIGLRQTLFFF